jgi:DNA repair protein RadC
MADSYRLARRRLLLRGADGLGDAELLALWLGLPDTVGAGEVLDAMGGLAGIGRTPLRRLLGSPGLGEARAARLLAATALLERRALAALDAGPLLSCSTAVRRFLKGRLAGAAREIFGCLFLDSRHRLIRFEALFLGTVDRAQVHPREILRRALELNAAALILAHNHPSGIAEPSASDIALTRDVVELLAKVDVRVLDHLVVGGGGDVSFAERGLL